MDKSKMNNLGINVKINGRQICKAGFDKEKFVLTPMVSLVHRRLFLSLYPSEVLDKKVQSSIELTNLIMTSTIIKDVLIKKC